MRVFVDSNVLLSGALYLDSYAARLASLTDTTFVVSEYCLAECRRVLSSATPRRRIAAAATRMVDFFVRRLNATIVPDTFGFPAGLPDPDDEPVLAGAVASGSDAICTYNLRDLRPGSVPVLTPLGVLKRSGARELFTFIQFPVLGARGTVLLLGILHHATALGEVLISANGTRVYNDSEGFVRVEGPQVSRTTSRQQLLGNQFLAFVLRYKDSGEFEASMWLPEPRNKFQQRGQRYDKIVLTEGRAQFTVPVVPRLVFNGNFGFFGVVLNLSAMPHYLRDADAPMVIEDGSLEALIGSEPVRELLEMCEFFRLPDGTVWFGIRPVFPRDADAA